jgi:hypothetical protein
MNRFLIVLMLASTATSVGADTGVENIRMNPKFYQRLDRRVEAVNAHGVLAALVQTWGLRKEGSGKYLPESQLIRLMRYLEARYGANHVVWILTGDAH